MVEYAPFQKVPATRTKKLPMEGTIEKGRQLAGDHLCHLARSVQNHTQVMAVAAAVWPAP